MKAIRLLAGLMIIGWMASCNISEKFRYYHIYMETDELSGLREQSPVMSQGIQVGKVNKLRRDGKHFYVDIMLLNDFLLPVGSDLRIVTDIENANAYLEIQVSHSKKYYSKYDTVKADAGIMLNKNVILEEVEVNPDSMDAAIRHLFSPK
jgi:ABC-type transporter Mla subunit MlaD